MSGYRSHISLLLLLVVLTGTILSTSHIHERDLGDYHTDSEQQIVENDLLCPICATIIFLMDEDPVLQQQLTLLQDKLLPFTPIQFTIETEFLLFGRAPPVSA